MGQANGYFVKCSPAGDRIACIWQQENWSPTEDLYVTDGDGGNGRVLYRDPGDDHLDRTPVWSRDGKTVYWGHRMSAGYDETAENSAAIVCKSVASSRPDTAWDSVVVPNDGKGKWLMSVSPDGGRMAITDSTNHLYVWDIKTGRSACVLSGDAIGPGEWGVLDKPK
jgi:Tol biopolymer transport system component